MDTFRGSLLLSTQGMTGGLAGAAPRGLDRSPEGMAPPGLGGRRALAHIVIRTAGIHFSMFTPPYFWLATLV